MIKKQGLIYFVLALAMLLLMLLASCSHSQIKPWGSTTTFTPGWEAIKRSAKDSFFDNETWIPLTGAAIIGFTNLDQKISDYATEKSPLFGDSHTAIVKSDDLFNASKVVFIGSGLATAGADNMTDTVRMKSKALAAQSMAIGMNNFVTGSLKTLSKRIPPNHIGSDSLTSRHASGAFLFSTVTRNNMRHITTSNVWQRSTDVAMVGTASVIAWGRVEGGLHYPSDVLVGSALGNFFANFVHRAFVDPGLHDHYSLQFLKTRNESQLAINYNF